MTIPHSTEPAFVLSGPSGTLVADRAAAPFADVDAARAALRSATAPLVVGALPFDPAATPALFVPDAAGLAMRLD